jgi:acetyl esterase/lipase
MAECATVAFYRRMEYAHVGAKRLTMDLYVPQGAQGPAPVVLWIYGSAWLDRTLYVYGPPILGLLERGYAVAQIDYRMTSEGYLFPAQVQDCKTAVRFLRARAAEFGLDPRRVGASGESAGGHLSALLGLAVDQPDLEGELHPGYSSAVQAVCDIYGPSDLLAMDQQRLPGGQVHDVADSPESRLVGGPIQENREKVARANPLTYIQGRTGRIPPFLLFHGDRDPNVPYGQSVLLYEALRAAGAKVAFHTIAGAGHSLAFFPQIEPTLIAFFCENL